MKYFYFLPVLFLFSFTHSAAQNTCPSLSNTIQHFCKYDYPEYAKVKLLTAIDNGGGVAWYSDNISTVPLNPEDLLVDGQVYYAGSIDGSCSGNRIAVTAELEDFPVAGRTTFLEFDSNQGPIDLFPLIQDTPVGPAQPGGTMVPSVDAGGTIFEPAVDANFTGRAQYRHWVYSNNEYCPDDSTVLYITVNPAPNTSHRLYYLGINEPDAKKYLEYYPPSSQDEGLEVNIWLDVPLEIGSVYKMEVNGQDRYYYVNNVYATPDTTPDLTLTSDTPMVKLTWETLGEPGEEDSGLSVPEYDSYNGPVLSDENYVYTRIPQVGVSSMDAIATTGEVVEQVAYFDGLGRPKQSVAIRAGGGQEDLITPVDYDDYGRQTKEYLPFAAESMGGQYNPSALSQVQDFYNTPEFENTPNPFSESDLEESPLNRVLKQAAPGADWKLGGGHEIEFGYASNDSVEVRLFQVEFAGGDPGAPTLTIAPEEYYLPGTLYKSITRDENHSGTTKNHTTEEFKDRQGRVVLKRTYADTPQQAQDPHDTYYVYDAYGNLTYVLPPKMEGSTATLNTILADLPELGYQYIYDGRNRLVQKQLPGKGEEYVIYNGLDQPVLTQDANLRLEYKWLYTKYDAHGRVTSTGIYTDSQTLGRENKQVQVDNFYSGTTPPKMYEQKSGSVYSNQAFPVSGTEVLTENFYDDYNFNKGLITVPEASIYGKNLTAATKGLATGSRVKVLGEPHWIVSVSGYDDKGRGIWSASKNPFLGTEDEVHSELDFVGKVKRQTELHTRDTLEITIENFYTYDHMGRQLMHTQKINGGEEELIAHNTYDALGQLVQKRVGGQLGNETITTTTPTTFTDLVGVTVGTEGSITKSIATNVWGDAGLATENSFTRDGYVEFVVTQTDKRLMVGISATNANSHYNTINFAFSTRNDQKLFVYQNGSNQSGNNGLSTYAIGDTLRIERIGSTVYFKKNRTVLYAILTTGTADMIGDVAFNTAGGSISNLTLEQKSSGGFQPLQTVDYAYNIRGWLKSINDPTELGEDLFGFEISYNDPRSGGTILYNGNISETHWNTLSENNTFNPVSNAYIYSYDPLNRIKSAIDNTGNYNLDHMSYDKNGNIMGLSRKGHVNVDVTTFDVMDNLTYTYNSGNKLLGVMDAINTPALMQGEFIDGNKNGNDYLYDDNGNLTSDLNKGINVITYNHLNLPEIVTISGQTIDYSYSADGTKLKKTFGNTNTEYAGNFIYTDVTLEFFNTPEGYVSYDNSQFNYVYNYVDHLGNVRLTYADLNNNGTIDPSSEILDEKNYYPFGLQHKGYNNVINGTENNYQTFMGQEEEKELGKNIYAFQWRDYDPAIARFNKIDRFAEKYYSISSYAFTANNPILYREIAGDSIGQGREHYDRFRQNAVDRRQRILDRREERLNNARESGNERREARLTKRYAQQDVDANSEISVLNQTITELDALESSNQVYNLVTNSPEVTGDQGGNITYNTDTGEVNVNVGGSYSTGLFGHELKHAFQYQTEALSFGQNGNGGMLYDIQDEVEAYARGAFFGEASRTVNEIKTLYPGISTRTTQRTLDTPMSRFGPATYRQAFQRLEGTANAQFYMQN